LRGSLRRGPGVDFDSVVANAAASSVPSSRSAKLGLNMRHRLFLAIAAIVAPAVPSLARNIDARSGSAVDIQAAIDLAHPGDTVVIPAGHFKFTGQVLSPDGIHIQGAGRDRTYLIKADNLGEWHAMITVDAKTRRPFIFSGITLEGRLDATQGSNRKTAATTVKDQGLLIRGAVKDLQIYDSRFTKFVRAGVELVGDAGAVHGPQTGVIYHNQFIDNWYSYLGYGVAVDGSASAWNRPAALGTGMPSRLPTGRPTWPATTRSRTTTRMPAPSMPMA
jgi:hypothetical protein